MSLSPEYLDGIAEPLQAIYSELQGVIQTDIARRIAKMGYTSDMAAWQIIKLQELGASQAFIATEIAKTLKISEKEVYSLFKQSGIKSMQTDIATQKELIRLGILPAETIPLTASASFAQVLNANALRTMNTMKKLTGTIALDASGKLNQYMDQCQLMAQSGAFTERDAIDTTVKKFAADGVGAFDYFSGVRTSVEAAVRRACVTGINQATAEVSINNAAELGTNLVEVTSHSDSRPQHAEWQGKIYRIVGSDEKYRNLKSATGYGTVTGLCGANCRHSLHPFIEGVSDKTPRQQYDPEIYEAEQEQRYNERQIRYWKRRADTLEAAGVNNKNELAKVRSWQARQREHLKNTGLVRDYSREKVGIANSADRDIIKLVKDGEDSLALKDFHDIEPFKGKLSDRAVRKWYKHHDESIPELLDGSLPLESQARQAFDLRNNYKQQARDLMRDQEKRKGLDVSDPIQSFEELVASKMDRKGLTRAEAVADIIKTATATRKSVNKSLGLE